MPRIQMPRISWSRIVPNQIGWMNIAVVGASALMLYTGLLMYQAIAARPPASVPEPSVAVDDMPNFKPVPEGTRIRVEVLNGAGIKGIAAHLTEKLREQNFDVVYEGNYKSNGRTTFNIRETIVIDRIGDPRYARRVASFLGVSPIVQQARADSLLDVTIIIGRDYRNLEAFR